MSVNEIASAVGFFLGGRGRVRKVCTVVSSLQHLLFSKSRKFRFSIPVFTSDAFSNYVEVKMSEIEISVHPSGFITAAAVFRKLK